MKIVDGLSKPTSGFCQLDAVQLPPFYTVVRHKKIVCALVKDPPVVMAGPGHDDCRYAQTDIAELAASSTPGWSRRLWHTVTYLINADAALTRMVSPEEESANA